MTDKAKEVTMQHAVVETPKKASLLKAMKTIGWAYLGVRSQRGYEEDIATITMGQTIVIGILFWLVFILTVASVALYVTS